MKKKLATYFVMAMFLVVFCSMGAFASEIMPLSGNECPNCGLDGYPQESTTWNDNAITTSSSSCGHGGGYGYNDVTSTYAGVHVAVCPHCGYGSQSVVYRTETYCFYLNCTV